MRIEIVSVTETEKTNKAGRKYSELEVIYKNEEGKAQTKKLMSFTNPAVFKAVKSASAGDKLNVITQKDDNGYWQWTGLSEDTKPTQQAATRVTGSNYETKEERALRQKYIVRQSSLTTAVAIMSVGAKNLDKHEVIALAEELEGWVFRTEIDELEDDIPF